MNIKHYNGTQRKPTTGKPKEWKYTLTLMGG